VGDVAVGRLAAAALCAALLGAGCGERAEPVDRAAVVYPLTVGGVTLPEPPAEVVAIGGSAMVSLLERLGVEPARTSTPDLVLAWADEVGGEIDPSGPVYFAPDATLDELERSVATVGLLVNRPEQAREVVAEIRADRADGRRLAAGKPRVRVFVDLGFFATAGERTLVGDIVREAGGVNVAGPTPEPGPFPLRQLAAADPEVYVISSESRTTRDFLLANPVTRKLAAVRDDRVVVVPAERLKPGPESGAGVLALALALHGDAAR
jgi:ABC-type Fe3+-hydroxamate transport system substrate-binding protein